MLGDEPVLEETIASTKTTNVSAAAPGPHGDSVDANQVQLKAGETVEVCI